MLSSEAIASAVALAQEYLEDAARNDKGPIRFHVRGYQEGGELFDRQLSADCLYTPPWGWPVLDSHTSTAVLSETLESFYSPGMKTAILTAESPRRQMEVVCDFMDPHLKTINRTADDVDVQVQGLTEAVAEICAEELAPGECVAVVCPDMAPLDWLLRQEWAGSARCAGSGPERICLYAPAWHSAGRFRENRRLWRRPGSAPESAPACRP